jgi:hypothetical protein
MDAALAAMDPGVAKLLAGIPPRLFDRIDKDGSLGMKLLDGMALHSSEDLQAAIDELAAAITAAKAKQPVPEETDAGMLPVPIEEHLLGRLRALDRLTCDIGISFGKDDLAPVSKSTPEDPDAGMMPEPHRFWRDMTQEEKREALRNEHLAETFPDDDDEFAKDSAIAAAHPAVASVLARIPLALMGELTGDVVGGWDASPSQPLVAFIGADNAEALLVAMTELEAAIATSEQAKCPAPDLAIRLFKRLRADAFRRKFTGSADEFLAGFKHGR